MKVLHIVHSLRPGGMENGVVNLASQLAGHGVRSDVCCLDSSGAFAARLPGASRVHVLGKPEGFQWRAVMQLKALIGVERPDVVHSHCMGPLLYAGLAKLSGRGFRLLHGDHGSLQPHELTPRRIMMRKFLYRCCDGLHTVSQGLTEEILERGLTRKPVQTIANGVDTVRFQPADDPLAARSAIGLPPDAQVIGIVGRFLVFKRHDRLLEAFQQLAEEFPRLHLLIVGARGETEEAIRAQAAASSYTSRIHFTGFTEKPERYYQAMNLLAMPSEKEGMSNALLESMACGVPALCSGACGNAEVLRHREDGLLYDLPDAQALAGHLADCLRQPEWLVELGAAARRTVQQRFSLEAMSRQYLALYERLCTT